MIDQEKTQLPTLAEIRREAERIAEEMRGAGGPLSPALRQRFIEVRSALFQRGIFDPVLVRFDTATVAQASPEEVAGQLSAVAASLAAPAETES